MAHPIERTPELSGEDARRFIELTLQEERSPDPKRLAFLKKCWDAYWENPF